VICHNGCCLGAFSPYFVTVWLWRGWKRWPFVKVCRFCGVPRGTSRAELEQESAAWRQRAEAALAAGQDGEGSKR